MWTELQHKEELLPYWEGWIPERRGTARPARSRGETKSRAQGGGWRGDDKEKTEEAMLGGDGVARR